MRVNGLGYKPDHNDPRDFKFGQLLRASAAPPPRSDALKSYAGDLSDQEDAEGCVGWSLSGALLARWNYLLALQNLPPMTVRPSAMWVWWLARKLEGTQGSNVGCYIRSATKQIAAMGVCSEAHWKSNPPTELVDPSHPRFALQPSVDAFQHAADQRFPVGYYRVGDLLVERKAQMQQAMSSGFPIVLGTQITTAFMALGQHAPLQPPTSTDQIAGGHALRCLYYDELGVYGPNTWQDKEKGIYWGNDGWFALSWEYVLWQYTQDLWAVDAALPKVWL